MQHESFRSRRPRARPLFISSSQRAISKTVILEYQPTEEHVLKIITQKKDGQTWESNEKIWKVKYVTIEK